MVSSGDRSSHRVTRWHRMDPGLGRSCTATTTSTALQRHQNSAIGCGVADLDEAKWLVTSVAESVAASLVGATAYSHTGSPPPPEAECSIAGRLEVPGCSDTCTTLLSLRGGVTGRVGASVTSMSGGIPAVGCCSTRLAEPLPPVEAAKQ
eukprot:scaffold10537_cov122-Isochrysis_galbana.AAC.1